MTKIRELNNAQLLKSIVKYQKLLNGLHKERNQRVRENPACKKELFTSEELAAQPAPSSALAPAPRAKPEETGTTSATVESDSSFQINFEESEINEIAKKTEQEQKEVQKEEDSVRMTEVLQLTSDQLKEFNKQDQVEPPKKQKKTKKS